MILQSSNPQLQDHLWISKMSTTSSTESTERAVTIACDDDRPMVLPLHLKTYPHSQSAPLKPGKFPKAKINSCKRIMVQKGDDFVQVLIPKCKTPNYAYWLQKSKRGTLYGNLWRAVILTRGDGFKHGKQWDEWKITDVKCAVKEFEHEKLKNSKDSNEDPYKEIAAMQYIKNIVTEGKEEEEDVLERARQNRQRVLDSRVMLPLEAMKSTGTSKSIYLVMTYIEGGDLIDQMDRVEDYGFSEYDCRQYMSDILKGVECLHSAGICHRDLSAENVLVSKEGIAVIADFGMCLRIPYYRQKRCLIKDQHSCGKLYCTPPEVIEKLPFDGHATDIWALGPILFKMRTGGAVPWEKACWGYNLKFKYFLRGNWKEWVELLTRSKTSDDTVDPVGLYLRDNGFSVNTLSPQCLDLMRKICKFNPEKRLTVREIEQHPWWFQE